MNNKEFSSRRLPTDCWNAHLLDHAEYSKTDLPRFESSNTIPSGLISFKNASRSENKREWIHFYENDQRLELVWESPELWAKRLQGFSGMISPDLSVYRDMPLPVQIWNTYRNRVLAHYFSQQGFQVIPNIRFGSEETYSFCFDGIEPHKPVCISTLGVVSSLEDRKCLKKGLTELLIRLSPNVVMVYGQMPSDVFLEYQNAGVPFVHFNTDAQRAKERKVK